jgi:hypothetical protein
LLHNGRHAGHAATNLCDLDNDDGLACYYVFSRFKTCHTTLDLLGETLSQYDVVLEDEIKTCRTTLDLLGETLS